MTQIAYLHVHAYPRSSAPPETAALARLLSGAGVRIRTAPKDAPCFVEICRPERTIGALPHGTFPIDEAHDPNQSDARERSCFVARAPRLRRLTLAAAQGSDEEATRQLFEELRSREIELIVLCAPDGSVRLQSWEGAAEALPVYPDLWSFHRAADDLKLAPETFIGTPVAPRALFARVDQDRFDGVALNAYSDPATPTYFIIDSAQARDLASGRMPASPWTDRRTHE
jgi:hypothetical protein